MKSTVENWSVGFAIRCFHRSCEWLVAIYFDSSSTQYPCHASTTITFRSVLETFLLRLIAIEPRELYTYHGGIQMLFYLVWSHRPWQRR
jgi:hypothetical protein